MIKVIPINFLVAVFFYSRILRGCMVDILGERETAPAVEISRGNI